jgi:hypothetical protein
MKRLKRVNLGLSPQKRLKLGGKGGRGRHSAALDSATKSTTNDP